MIDNSNYTNKTSYLHFHRHSSLLDFTEFTTRNESVEMARFLVTTYGKNEISVDSISHSNT